MKNKLYSTHCPRCVVLEKKMDQKGIKYNMIDDQNRIINKGFMTVPILEVDGEVMDFKRAVDWADGQE